MGKITLTPTQKQILDIIISDPYFPTTFYMTCGTALSAFYYHHRASEDIDLFTQHPFDETRVSAWMKKQQKIHGWKLTYTKVFERQTYEISWKNHHGKIDFVRYDFKRLAPSTLSYRGIQIDSIADIAVNKLFSISQRSAVKDFVDLYFLLKKDFTWWDMMGSVDRKFGIEIEKVYLSSLLTKVEAFDTLPVMKKTLSLNTLKTFFLSEAKKLALPMTKP